MEFLVRTGLSATLQWSDRFDGAAFGAFEPLSWFASINPASSELDTPEGGCRMLLRKDRVEFANPVRIL
jgi:hypothetical protein